MFNLIKMDLHRLTHSVSTWIFMAFTILLAFFCVAMTNSDLQSMAANPQSMEEVQTEITSNEDRNIGIYVESNPEWVNGKIEAGNIISVEVKSGLLVLLCVIFTALFVNAEQRNGYIKNIAGQIPNRGMMVLSKLAAIAVQVLLMLVAFSATVALFGLAFWGGRFYLGSASELVKFLGTQYLLHLGSSALIMFLCILTRSSAFSMVAGLLTSCGVLVPVYSLINKIVYNIRPSWNFDISRYMLDGNISMAGINATSDVLIHAVLIGCIFAVVCTALSMLIMKKRDIR